MRFFFPAAWESGLKLGGNLFLPRRTNPPSRLMVDCFSKTRGGILRYSNRPGCDSPVPTPCHIQPLPLTVLKPRPECPGMSVLSVLSVFYLAGSLFVGYTGGTSCYILKAARYSPSAAFSPSHQTDSQGVALCAALSLSALQL